MIVPKKEEIPDLTTLAALLASSNYAKDTDGLSSLDFMGYFSYGDFVFQALRGIIHDDGGILLHSLRKLRQVALHEFDHGGRLRRSDRN